MTIWLAMICLSAKTEHSVKNDCLPLAAFDCSGLAEERLAQLCGGDKTCGGKGVIEKMPLETAEPKHWWLPGGD